MSTIVENQRRAFLARSMDAASDLTRELANLSDAQRSVILAIIAKNTSTPVDIVFWADHGDRQQIAEIAAGKLKHGDDQNSYLLGSGCLFQVVSPPRGE